VPKADIRPAANLAATAPQGVSTRRAQLPLDEISAAVRLASNKLALGTMMASDDKKIKADPVAKNEPPPKDKSTSDASPPKAEGGETAAGAPSGYSRGEGQKPVSKAYKDNWNAIYAKKKKR
jgi:hypothetical protein